MAHKLFNLRNVPADELDDIYALLESQGIEFYETNAGTFGISLPALWVSDDSHYARARALLDAYADERARRVRAQFEADLAAGRQRTVVDLFREHPLRFIAYTMLAAGLLYLSTVHFWIASR
jgi:hypothetical protein